VLKNIFYRIQRHTFERIANYICEIFSKEKQFTWFKAYPRTYDGLLYSSYRTHRNKCIKAGISLCSDIVIDLDLNIGRINLIQTKSL
jgi:hypothetical protein